jgi:hypothetical protein
MKKIALLLALVSAPAFADAPKTADKAPAGDTAKDAPKTDAPKTDTKATTKKTTTKTTKSTDKTPAKDAPKTDTKAPAKS